MKFLYRAVLSPRALVAIALAVGAGFARAQQYTITDVGTIGTGNESIAYSVNSLGQVCGWSRITPGGNRHGFMWSNGTITDVGTLLTGSESFAYGINDSGTVVGRSFTSGSTGDRAYRWSNGTLTDLSTLGLSTTSEAWDINNSGQIVGINGATGSRQAFRITNNTVTLIPGSFVNMGESFGDGLNTAGQVVGYASSTNQGNQRAFYWPGSGNIQQLAATLGGSDSLAHDINSTGQITGFSDTTNDAQTYAFIYSGSTMTSLGALGTGIYSEGWAINDSGVVVGSASLIASDSDTTHAFVTSGTTMIDLNSLIDPSSGWLLTDARDINNSGQIVGKGTINGQGHAFIATPIPAWNNAAGGVWATSSNWGPVAPSTTGLARFNLNAASPYTVTFNAPAQIGTLLIQTDKVSFNLSSQTLTAGTAVSIAALSGQTGQLSISNGTLSAPNVYVGGNSTSAGGAGALNVNAGATLSIPGTLKIWNTSNTQVTLNGGTISTGAIDTNSNPSHLFGNGTTSGWVSGAVELTNSNLDISPSGQLGSSVTLNTGKTLRVKTNSQYVTVQSGSTLAFAGGKLDLTNKKLIEFNGDVGSWNSTSYTGVTGQIAAARNTGTGGLWTGSGIGTSMSDAAGYLTTLAVATASQVGKSQFANLPVSGSDVLVMYTYAGDANLDGQVNGDDYFAIDQGFQNHAHGFINGDFNYDGKINADDYFLIDRSYAHQTLGIFSAGAIAQPSSAITAVPEPASFTLIGAAIALITTRRRRFH